MKCFSTSLLMSRVAGMIACRQSNSRVSRSEVSPYTAHEQQNEMLLMLGNKAKTTATDRVAEPIRFVPDQKPPK